MSAMFLYVKIYFLVWNYLISSISCGYINSTAHGAHEAGRNGRFFGLFNIVSFRDDECDSTMTGVQGIVFYKHVFIFYINHGFALLTSSLP